MSCVPLALTAVVAGKLAVDAPDAANVSDIYESDLGSALPDAQ